MNTLIIDDEWDGIHALTKMLARYCPEVNLCGVGQNIDQARQLLAEQPADLVFLDVQMPEKSGLEMLEEFPGKTFEVIFVTAHHHYMLQALHFSAVDYLLKPVDEDKLVDAVGRAARRLAIGGSARRADAMRHNFRNIGSPAEMRVCLPSVKGFSILKQEEILYCEAERSYTVFHLAQGRSVTVARPLSDYETLLEGTNFLRVHKSFLVNLQYVQEYQRGEGGMLVMCNGDEIEVSRRRKEVFMSRIREFCRI